jgi:hypothetical protein
MARNEGVTLTEFAELLSRRRVELRGPRTASLRDTEEFLDRCIERGLVTRAVDLDGRTRYRPTIDLTLMFGEIE